MANLGRHALLEGRSAWNLVLYGKEAPRPLQRIWFDANACDTSMAKAVPNSLSGKIVGGDWDLNATPLEKREVIRLCLMHWRDGVPWEDTGIYEWQLARIKDLGGVKDRCRTIDDVVARYQALDRMFEQARSERALRPGPHPAIEPGGIRISLGRQRQPIFGHAGNHRLAAARVLGLTHVPAQVLLVHPHALRAQRLAAVD